MSAENGLFSGDLKVTDQVFETIKSFDHPSAKRDKAFLEELWQQYRLYADTKFRTQIRESFQQSFWEMYLGVTLLENEHTIESKDSGPDFKIANFKGKTIWIEATAPNRGVTEHKVPELNYGSDIAERYPEEEIILRLRSSIRAKFETADSTYRKGITKKLIKKNDCYVIAINVKAAAALRHDITPPLIVKATLGIGHLAISFNKDPSKPSEPFITQRTSIEKGEKNVTTNIFFDPEYKQLSAVISSFVDPTNRPDNFGKNFILVHNPYASNPLPEGLFDHSEEISVDICGTECTLKYNSRNK
jgi:hypothetical protein